jgi:hypothetical protein
MKRGMFLLTKPEQRVVIIIVMALLAGAFIRYWRDAKQQQALNRAHPINAIATPFASPSVIPLDLDDAEATDTPPSPRHSQRSTHSRSQTDTASTPSED